MNSEARWEFRKGADILGTLHLLTVDHPRFECLFVPTQLFEQYESLFVEELKLLNNDKMDEWEKVYDQIDQLNLSLISILPNGSRFSDFLIHIEGQQAKFRYYRKSFR